MEKNLKNLKTEIIDWIQSIEDEALIFEILRLKNRMEIPSVAEGKTAYAVEGDFEKRFAEGIPADKMRKLTEEHIRNLPWKQ